MTLESKIRYLKRHGWEEHKTYLSKKSSIIWLNDLENMDFNQLTDYANI